ncbi:MAG: cation:proton antiporter [Candidatus Diapherotrites archaeon]
MPIENFGLLIDLGLILLSATAFNFIARYFKQPPILSFIFAGIAIGPLFLGSLGLSFNGIRLGITKVEEILVLSELGIAFLLFYVGIDSNISKLKEFGKIAFIGTIAQVVITLSLVLLFNSILGVLSLEQAIYFGVIMSFSSTAIVVKLLSDAKKINTLESRLMLSFLLTQDFLAILAISFLSNFQNIYSSQIIIELFTKIIILIILAYLLNRILYQKVFYFATKSDELFLLTTTSCVFLFMFVCYVLELPISIGAFIAGLSISNLPYTVEMLGKIRSLRDFLGTIFFVTLGIQINPSFLTFSFELAIFVLFILLIIKPLAYFLTSISFGYGGKTSFLVALSLTQVSEFSFIIASQGKSILEQTPGFYSFIILVIAFSIGLTPYFMKYSDKLYNFFSSNLKFLVNNVRKIKYFYRKLNTLSNVKKSYSDHIVIFGAGTIGSGIISAFKDKHDLIAIDNNPEIILKLIKQKTSCIYGSLETQEVWDKANLEKSKIVAIAIPFNNYVPLLIKKLKEKNESCVIFARCHYFNDALTLYEAGADFVIMPQVAGTNLFIKKMAEFIEKGKVYEISNYQQAFMDYLKEKAKEERETNY